MYLILPVLLGTLSVLDLTLSAIFHFSYEHCDQRITPLYRNVLMGIQEQPKSQFAIVIE